ncbi:tetratricopeptide repeat protein [Planobacterium oryzisoli]|uniref:Tetratricopeptide repeat protein n=1 Tax=Planobacterium oryzisoli TaxID=2771435 RepID=A0A931E5G4_9FLAO|nr:tetratricopeptide repeat protein [Planobacterium oryzisoli]MBF5027020.1 tetratricopeptide repeat protein [Planobacterium oryzisoli]
MHFQRIIFFFVFSLSLPLVGQRISLDVKYSERANLYESLLNQQQDFGCDTLKMHRFLEPIKNSDDPNIQVLYHVLLGQGYAHCFQRVTLKSNQHYLRAIELSKKGPVSLQVVANVNYAQYLYHFRSMNASLAYFLQAESLLLASENFPHINPQDSYRWIGYYYGTIGDRSTAIQMLEKAKQFTSEGESDYAGVIDNLGLYLMYEGRYAQAQSYFHQALGASKKAGDSLRYAKVLANMGDLMYREKRPVDGLNLVKKGLKISRRMKAEMNTLYTLTILAKIQLALEDYPAAEKSLLEASTIYKSTPRFATNGVEVEELKAQLYKATGDPLKELEAHHAIDFLEEQLQYTDGDTALNRANLLLNRSRSQRLALEVENERREMLFMRLLYFTSLVLILGILYYILTTSRRALKQRKMQYTQHVMELELEKMRYEQSLSKTKLSLEKQVAHLRHKDRQIAKLQSEMEQVSQSNLNEFEQESHALSKLLESHLMTDENWQQFKREFMKLQPEFYKQLTREFPELRESAHRILILKRLGFSNLEIARLLGVSQDAIKKSLQRVKLKLAERYAKLKELVGI